MAQLNFKTAGEESGLITAKTSALNVGYSFSASEARFILGDTKQEVNDKLTTNKLMGNNFKVAVPITDGTNSIYSGGAFNPGIGLNYEKYFSKNTFAKNPLFWFFRWGYDLKQNKFGSINSTDSIIINSKLSHAFGITPGLNILFAGKKNTDNVIVAFSIPIIYNIKSVQGLKAKDFVVFQNRASNGSIQKAEKAYDKFQKDFLSVSPKIDFAWTPFLMKLDSVEAGTRIGFISSISSKYNSRTGKIAWNFSIGPSLHPKFSTSNVIATIQAEFLDFNNSTGEKKFNDIFFVNFYLGIPIQMK